MTNTQKINGDHIKSARLFRGLSLSDLSNKTGITKQALSLYENETIRPEISKLVAIAQALDFPIEYFMSLDNFQVKTESTYFRSLLSTPKIARTAQSVRVEFIAKIYEILIDYVDFPDRNFPDIAFSGRNAFSVCADEEVTSGIESIVTQCRKFW